MMEALAASARFKESLYPASLNVDVDDISVAATLKQSNVTVQVRMCKYDSTQNIPTSNEDFKIEQ
jgi:mannose/fructose/N-acetylgalactosamine-specific phosphotransferase system component IIB